MSKVWKYRIIILVLILGFIAVLTSIGIKQHEQVTFGGGIGIGWKL